MEEKSIFLKTFGDYPLLRILDFLLTSKDFDYPITEIARNSKVNFQTFKKVWPGMEEKELVVHTRTLSGTKLFKLNMQNPVIQKLVELDKAICWQYSEQTSKISA